MAGKEMTLIFYGQEHNRPDWKVDPCSAAFEIFLIELKEDMKRFGVVLQHRQENETVISINSYGDLLNAVRISSPSDNIGSICIGHVLGKSQNLDFMEDIKRAVSRVAFAPETIPPEDHNRKVCHNCGCGC